MMEPAALQELFQPVSSCPANISFRAARLSDAASFRAACYSERNKVRFKARFHNSLKRQEAGKLLYLVAVAGGVSAGEKVVGGGKLIRRGNAFEIADLIVEPIWRGQGIGAAIITIMIRLARDAGASAVEIGALHENRRALALYRRLGFLEMRELSRPGKKPATILRRPIL